MRHARAAVSKALTPVISAAGSGAKRDVWLPGTARSVLAAHERLVLEHRLPAEGGAVRVADTGDGAGVDAGEREVVGEGELRRAGAAGSGALGLRHPPDGVEDACEQAVGEHLEGAEEIGVLVLLLPDQGGAYGPVTAHRDRLRVRRALHRALGADVLVAFDRPRVRVLLPGPQDAADLGGRLAGVFDGMPARAGLTVAAGPGEVASAARTADRVLTVATACGRPPGVHRLSDVLLEYHLSLPGESGARIAALLDPVADRPELIDTARVHLRLARHRRATARELGLHPNTVDNRLTRLATLTGIDVTTDHGAALLLAATLLREVDDTDIPEPGPATSGRTGAERLRAPRRRRATATGR